MEKRTGWALGSLAAGVLLAVSAFGEPSMDGMSMAAHGHGGMGHHMDAMGGGDSHFMMLLKSANLTPGRS